MKKKSAILICLFIGFNFLVYSDSLYTIDGKIYEGKMVEFKYETVYFNVYKFGKFFRSERFPLWLVWKVEFNIPQKDSLLSNFEIDQLYKKFRKGKRIKKINLMADMNWLNTGINVKIGQDILFAVTGSIYITEEVKVFHNGEFPLNWHRGKPLSNHPTGAVIAKIGKKGQPFYVGDDKAPFYISKKGKLYIGINDYNFEDNSSSFMVTIYY